LYVGEVCSPKALHVLACTFRFLGEIAQRDGFLNRKPKVATSLDEAKF
jgi:hypothetical protein